MYSRSIPCECFTCGTQFQGPVFRIAREWRRVHYVDEKPECEFWDADGIETYCSLRCMQIRLPLVMARESTPIQPPGRGPIGLCARCGSIVDMSTPHLGYSSEKDEARDSSLMADVTKLDVIAVLCKQCEWPVSDIDEHS
jgi:hypothetical protein